MMNYSLFKEQVAEHFGEFVPEHFSDYRVELYTDSRHRERTDKLALIPPRNKELQVIPTLSLNQLYEDYRQNGDFETTLQEAMSRMDKAYQNVFADKQEQQRGITYERKQGR